MQKEPVWIKDRFGRYQNTQNGAFIVKFNFNSTRTYCVYLNKREYEGEHSDYRSTHYLKDAKRLGENIEDLGLVRIHT